MSPVPIDLATARSTLYSAVISDTLDSLGYRHQVLRPVSYTHLTLSTICSV